MTESEVWRDVVGYEGLYKVSNKGNIYSVERRDTIGRKCGGRIMQPVCNSYGYPHLNLYKNGVMKQKKVHRLVLEAFVPNPNNYPEVNHRDEDKANNNVENLEWCTRKYNNNHGKRTEKASQKLFKKVKAIHVETGEVLKFSSVKEAVSKGYSRSGVSKACRGVYNTGGGNLYRGHRWSYV